MFSLLLGRGSRCRHPPNKHLVLYADRQHSVTVVGMGERQAAVARLEEALGSTSDPVWLMPQASVRDGTMQGFVAVIKDVNAPVDAAYLVTPISGVSMYRVDNHADLGPDYFMARRTELASAVPQYADNAWSLETKDTTPWTACIGAAGNVKVVSRSDPVTHQANYFIVVRAELTTASKQFASRAAATGMTYKQLVDDTDWKCLVVANERNRNRLALQAANAMGVTIPSRSDNKAFAMAGTGGPQAGIPELNSNYNLFDSGPGEDGVPVLSYFNNAVRTDNAVNGLLLEVGGNAEIWCHGDPK